MSTTVVTQLTGEAGIDLPYQRFAVITVKENDVEEELTKALFNVSMDDLVDDDGELDEIEMRASLSSELKAAGLQLTGLQVCGFAWLGE